MAATSRNSTRAPRNYVNLWNVLSNDDFDWNAPNHVTDCAQAFSYLNAPDIEMLPPTCILHEVLDSIKGKPALQNEIANAFGPPPSKLGSDFTIAIELLLVPKTSENKYTYTLCAGLCPMLNEMTDLSKTYQSSANVRLFSGLNGELDKILKTGGVVASFVESLPDYWKQRFQAFEGHGDINWGSWISADKKSWVSASKPTRESNKYNIPLACVPVCVYDTGERLRVQGSEIITDRDALLHKMNTMYTKLQQQLHVHSDVYQNLQGFQAVNNHPVIITIDKPDDDEGAPANLPLVNDSFQAVAAAAASSPTPDDPDKTLKNDYVLQVQQNYPLAGQYATKIVDMAFEKHSTYDDDEVERLSGPTVVSRNRGKGFTQGPVDAAYTWLVNRLREKPVPPSPVKENISGRKVISHKSALQRKLHMDSNVAVLQSAAPEPNVTVLQSAAPEPNVTVPRPSRPPRPAAPKPNVSVSRPPRPPRPAAPEPSLDAPRPATPESNVNVSRPATPEPNVADLPSSSIDPRHGSPDGASRSFSPITPEAAPAKRQKIANANTTVLSAFASTSTSASAAAPPNTNMLPTAFTIPLKPGMDKSTTLNNVNALISCGFVQQPSENYPMIVNYDGTDSLLYLFPPTAGYVDKNKIIKFLDHFHKN